MKRYRIRIDGVCPSDWDIASIRTHLRRAFTQGEVDGAVICEVPTRIAGAAAPPLTDVEFVEFLREYLESSDLAAAWVLDRCTGIALALSANGSAAGQEQQTEKSAKP